MICGMPVKPPVVDLAVYREPCRVAAINRDQSALLLLWRLAAPARRRAARALQGAGEWMATIRAGFGAAMALAAGALVAQAAESPLQHLEAGEGRAGWDGIALGISAVQAERRVGATLAMEPAAKGTAMPCEAFTVTVERGTLRLKLGFPTAKPGAKLQSIYVHFEGYQVTARPEALVAELKARIPGATYLPEGGSSSAANPTEADDPTPTFLLPGAQEYVARIAPGDGLLLTLRSCLAGSR
jgi:hypothetical protein